MKTEPQSGKNYLYTSENLLDAVSGGGVPAATLTYDPLMRLYEDQSNTSGLGTQFVYDGTDMIAEYDQSNALQKRTVFGAGQPAPAEAGEPLVQLDAAGNRTWLTADERGSIIALSDDSGNVSAKNAYDEYGKPQPGNTGRFQYTGQAWIDDLGTSPASGQGLYYYKSRMYAPHLGRFMQPDPIGYAGDGLNLYAYVLNDPVNYLDPLGLCTLPGGYVNDGPNPIITCPRPGGGLNGSGASGGGGALSLLASFVSRAAPRRMQPSQTGSVMQCRIYSIRKNGLALGLDIGGIAAEGLLSEVSVPASVIASSIVGVAAIGNSIAQRQWAWAGAAYFGRHAGMAEGFTTGSTLRFVRNLSIGALAVSTVHDLLEAKASYDNCMNGREGQ